MIDEIISKSFLHEKLNSIKQFIPESEFKYYYIDSVENFILHIANFQSERTSARMAYHIDQYLSLLTQELQEPHDKHEMAKQLFPHIWNISITYQDELGFAHKTPVWIVIGEWAVVYLILQAIVPTSIALITTAIGAFVHCLIRYRKIKTRRTY